MKQRARKRAKLSPTHAPSNVERHRQDIKEIQRAVRDFKPLLVALVDVITKELP